MGIDGNDVIVHYVLDMGIAVRHKHFKNGDNALEFSVVRNNVAGIDSLLVQARRTDFCECLFNGHFSAQIDELRRHYAARAVLGIAQYFIDRFSVVLVQVRKYPADNVCRHVFEQVYGIVRKHIVKDFFDFFVGKNSEQKLLLIGVHIRERLSGNRLLNQSESNGEFVIGKIFQQRGNIYRIHLFERRAD